MSRNSYVAASIVISCLLSVTGCGSGTGTTAGSGGNPQAVVPTLTAILPTTIPSGSIARIITADGSGFNSGSVVQWNGTSLATTYVTASELTAQIPDAYVATSGLAQITVFNSGTGSSAPLTLSVTNLVPTLYSISPTSVPVGSPSITLTVNGKDFRSNSQITWNGASLTTTYVNTGQLAAQIQAASFTSAGYAQVSVVSPAPGGGQSINSTFSIFSGSNHVSVLPVNANDIIWDATRAKIYASLPSANGASGNSLVAIDPVTGAVGTPQYVGSEPNKLALSSDASHIWVGIDGSSAVKRFTLPAFTQDASITLASSTYALSIQAAPVNPKTVAVLPGASIFSVCCLTVYDDSTARPKVPVNVGFSGIQWGADDSAVYGGDLYADGGRNTFTTMNIDSTGVSSVSIHPNIFGLSPGGIHYDTGSGEVIADNGQVVDSSTGRRLGTLNLDFWLRYNGQVPQPVDSVYPRCVPDSSQGVVFCLGMNVSSYIIQSFDIKTFRLIDSLPIPQAPPAAGAAVHLLRWGKAGLAFNTIPTATTSSNPGSIFIIDGSFVNSNAPPDSTIGSGVEITPVLKSVSPQNAPAGSSDLTIKISGRNFLPGAAVYWDNFKVTANDWAPLSTVYKSSTELEATVPASDLATAGFASVRVVNGSSTNYSPGDPLGFTITPVNSGIITRNLASHDVVWDKNTGLLYAAVWDLDTQYPNSVVAIDPTTGNVVKSQTVGSDPYLVRTTDDGAYLYVAYLSNNRVSQLQMPALTSPLTWSLQLDPSDPASDFPWIALDLEPQPGASQTIAVALGLYSASPVGEGGITIFDNNVARPTRANGWGGSFGGDYLSLQWGAGSSVLYGADGTDLHTLVVSASGVSPLGNDYPLSTYRIVTPNTFIHYDASTGYIYTDGAQVVNPANGTIVGTFNSSNLQLPNSVSGFVIPDATLNRIFILGQTMAQLGSNNYTIQSYDKTSLAPVASTTIQAIGQIESFTRWGNTGLAFTTYTRYPDSSPAGTLYILNDSNFVSAKQSTLLPGQQLEPLYLTTKPVTGRGDSSAVR